MDKREDILEEENQKIDILPLMAGAWRHFKKTWWLLVLLCAVCGVLLCTYRIRTYTPVYVAYASFVVDSGAGTTSYASSLTKIEIAETFPYILESGALKNVVMEQLGVEELNATISASVLSDTSLLQISVSAGDAQYAYDVLEAVVENYPSVARYIIGETELTLLDSSGVPAGASNGYSVRSIFEQGALIGAAIYLGVLVFLLITRKTVLSEADLKDSISVNCLASIPQMHRKRRTKAQETCYLIDQKNIGEPFRESVNMLRIRADRQFEKNESKVILLTSAGEGEGKTTIAANLALSFSKKGYRVLVLDADLRSPSVARAFGREPGYGLRDVLDGAVAPEEALANYAKGIWLLSGKPVEGRSRIASILGGSGLKELLAAFRKNFDYIFIDTPPCGMLPDAITLAPACDEAILVVKQDFTAKDRVLSAMESLVNTGIRVAGFVINSERTGIGSYGYGRYGYGRYGYGRYGYGRYGYGYGRYGYGRYGYGRYGYGYGYGSREASGKDGGGDAGREEVFDPDVDVGKQD